ncbi:MAG: hypothetical protein AAF725_17315 [Acidobacteriota bacterium]
MNSNQKLETTETDNLPCRILGIAVPRLEEARHHREATTFPLLLVALLETGEPMTLEQVAQRFAEAGVAPFEKALRSLQRCRPGRPPVYRQGDLYSLDPHDQDLDLWVFRLGLRPAKGQIDAKSEEPQAPPEPVPGLDIPVTPAELEEAFTGSSLYSWSSQRLACLLMEAYREPMSRQLGSARLDQWTRDHRLRRDAPNRWTHGAVKEDERGSWTFDSEHRQVLSARRALRALLTTVRAEGGRRKKEEERRVEMSARAAEREAETQRAYEALRRCLLFAFPQESPRRIVKLDLASREMTIFKAADFKALRSKLESYDWIGALEARSLLTALGFQAGERHVAEMGPSQKTLAVPGRRPLKLTAEALVKGCTNFPKPFGNPKEMQRLLDQGKERLLNRRLDKAMRSLFSLYHYCKLHGAARVVRGDLEAWIPVPWVHWAEETLAKLKRRALENRLGIEAVIGPFFALEDSWRSAVRLMPVQTGPYSTALMQENGEWFFDEQFILAARLALPEDQESLLVN